MVLEPYHIIIFRVVAPVNCLKSKLNLDIVETVSTDLESANLEVTVSKDILHQNLCAQAIKYSLGTQAHITLQMKHRTSEEHGGLSKRKTKA